MGLSYFGTMEHQPRAARIAREIAKPLAVSDIESLLSDHLREEDLERLYTAVDSDYPKYKKANDVSGLEAIIQIAWFNLGWAAALRLMGTAPEIRIVSNSADKPDPQL